MQHHRILYRSDAALFGSSEDAADLLDAIVTGSQERNAVAGLTGALLLSAGVFIQVLEGPGDAVEQTFERICRDLRHCRVRLLEFVVADARQFGEWSMAQVTPTRELARIAPALDGGDGDGMDAISTGAVIDLMRALLLTGATADRRPDATGGRRASRG